MVGCPLNIALLRPASPRLNIGDTLTMHATSWVPRCLPPDTTANGVWWWAGSGEIAIDAQGHVTAVRPGFGVITMSQVGDSGALGQTDVGVFEPPGADSVVTIISNGFEDSARVMLQDANGMLQRSQTVAAGDSACWITPLSDSVRYSAVVYVPPPVGPDSAAARWTTLKYIHTFRIHFYAYSPSVPAWEPMAVNPAPGTGC